MDDRLKKLQQEVRQLDIKIENEDLKRQALQAQYRKKENKNRSREQSRRTHRLIEIGAEVESVMGRQIPKEDLLAFREYMKTAERKIGAFKVVDGKCSFLLP